jgi:hypothetical protein
LDYVLFMTTSVLLVDNRLVSESQVQ